MGSIRTLLSGKGAFHSRGHKRDGHVTCDTLVGEVPAMQESAPGDGNMETVGIWAWNTVSSQGAGTTEQGSLRWSAWPVPS